LLNVTVPPPDIVNVQPSWVARFKSLVVAQGDAIAIDENAANAKVVKNDLFTTNFIPKPPKRPMSALGSGGFPPALFHYLSKPT
jgi:hypothetical protein